MAAHELSAVKMYRNTGMNMEPEPGDPGFHSCFPPANQWPIKHRCIFCGTIFDRVSDAQLSNCEGPVKA